MSKTTFKTNPRPLNDLLRECASGKIQLPDFQRSWVWAEDRIIGLLASISRAFPVGALMTLESKRGAAEMFARRPLEGTSEDVKSVKPDELLLDGQQRMTSLFQACLRQQVVKTLTPKNKVIWRWFYLDIRKSLDPGVDREDAVIAVPEDRRVKTDFDRKIVLDLSQRQFEFDQMMFPLNRVFDWNEWQMELANDCFAKMDKSRLDLFARFKSEVLDLFTSYQLPVIALADDTTHEAVCLVFEKVNTGGKALDAFELLTAMYSAQGHKLRDDWLGKVSGTPGIQARLADYASASGQKTGVLSKVASTDFLQAIALLHTKEIRLAKVAEGVKPDDLPAVRATRQSLLDLPLIAYLKYRDRVEKGFERAAKFLREEHIYRVLDLPYQTQLVPLAAIFAEVGDAADHATNRGKIARWYWCGVFGELYGSAVESRFARDIMEVPAWLAGGPEPSTVTGGAFRADRLNTMRTRLSAAYKGIHALLMTKGAKDFLTGQEFDTTVFFGESVDIHHLFPVAWCKARTPPIDEKLYDTVVNKTPIGLKTNRIIGGAAPSQYLAKIEEGRKKKDGKLDVPPLAPEKLNDYLASHCINASCLRADDFDEFMDARRQALLQLIADATGHSIVDVPDSSDGEEPDGELCRDLEAQAE